MTDADLRNESLAFVNQWQTAPHFLGPFNGMVHCVNGKDVTTSLEVAKRFGKDHKNVLRDIRDLLDNLQTVEKEDSHDSRLLNFEQSRDKPFSENFILSSYTNSQGISQPMYNITRDGFSLLVMGFTGTEALKWKIKFIDAYNMMEKFFQIQMYCICHVSELLNLFLGARRSVGPSEIETYYFDPVQVDRRRGISLAVCDLDDSAFLRFFWKGQNIWNELLHVNLRQRYDELDEYWTSRATDEMLVDYPESV